MLLNRIEHFLKSHMTCSTGLIKQKKFMEQKKRVHGGIVIIEWVQFEMEGYGFGKNWIRKNKLILL